MCLGAAAFHSVFNERVADGAALFRRRDVAGVGCIGVCAVNGGGRQGVSAGCVLPVGEVSALLVGEVLKVPYGLHGVGGGHGQAVVVARMVGQAGANNSRMVQSWMAMRHLWLAVVAAAEPIGESSS